MTTYAVILFRDADLSWEGLEGARDEHRARSDELQAEGRMPAAIALEDSDQAVCLRPDGRMTDGPYVEGKEVMLGLYLLEADTLEEAVASARRNPILHQGGGVEVRPVEGFFLRPEGGTLSTPGGPI